LLLLLPQMFVTIFAILFTTFIIFLNISHLHALLPVNYAKMVTFFGDLREIGTNANVIINRTVYFPRVVCTYICRWVCRHI
jgi:hypothetical protein